MANQRELDRCYMLVAEAHAQLSRGVRAKVGACIVTRNGTVLAGCNGLASGGSNILEYTDEKGALVTKPETIHAELNCILKAAKEGVSVLDGTLYVTMICCLPCSEMVIAAGIKRVVYRDGYRCTKGLQNLLNRNIIVQQFIGE